MWSFDRYGRWIEQRRDWAREPAPAETQPAEAPRNADLDLAELTELVDRLEKRSP